MSEKLGYKTFEHLCDLLREDTRLRTWETLRALDEAQAACGWPWCLTQAQMDDWQALYQRLDP